MSSEDTDIARIREAASAFAAEHVAPRAARWAAERRMGLESLAAAAEAGLLALEVPAAFGGQGAGFKAKLALVEALAAESYDFAFSLINTHNVAAKLARDAAPELAWRYVPALMRAERVGATALTEPQAGSDFAAIRTRATRDGDGWRLEGAKACITNAAIADVFVTYAQTDPTQGWRGIACFLVDGTRAGFVRAAPESLGAGMPIGAGGFRLEGYRAEAAELLHPPGEAFKLAMASVNGARTYVAAMCCAMVERCLEVAIAYGKARTAFGRPIVENQGLRWLLADVATDLEAARLLVEKAAALVEEGGDAALAAAHAKKLATRMAVARISDCMQAVGAAGLRDEYPFVRHLGSARVASYTDGSTEMQNERIAAIVLR
jgi:alkylation response protein AidB-like acyl-CoA dehydrogenase